MRKKIHLSALVYTLIIILLLARGHGQGSAQELLPAFWRYDAPGSLNFIEVADVDANGIAEILVVSDDVNLMLLGPDGIPRWSVPYRTSAPIIGLEVANFIGEESDGAEIVVGTEEQLLLLNNSGQESWRRTLDARAADLVVAENSSRDQADIVVLSENGDLQRFKGNGQLLWNYEHSEAPSDNPAPTILAADLDNDGSSEFVFSYITSDGLNQLVLIDETGQTLWKKPANGRIVAVEAAPFEKGGNQDIAVATSLDRVYLYDIDGNVLWPYRSPNKDITSLAFAVIDHEPALLVGTSVGTLLAYDLEGRRLWSGHYSSSADRPVLALSTAAESNEDDSLSLEFLLGSDSDDGVSPEIFLLNSSGQQLRSPILTSDSEGLSRLTDLNKDGRDELLLAGFATVELIDPGIGVRQYSTAWDYRLDAKPESALAADINQDGSEELLLGTADGRVHALSKDGALLWVTDLANAVTIIAVPDGASDRPSRIVAVSNDLSTEPDPEQENEGWLTVLRPDGRILWSQPSPSTIPALVTGDINRNAVPEIIAGSSDGIVKAFSLEGDQYWQADLTASIDQLLLVEGARGTEIMIGTGANTIERLNNKGAGPIRTARYLEGISHLDKGPNIEDSTATLFVSLDDGTVRLLNSRGSQQWSADIEGVPQVTESAENSLLISTDEQTLLRLDFNGDVIWRLSDLGRVTDVYWGDLDGDLKPDVTIGNREGLIRLIDDETTITWDVLNAASGLFFVSGLRGSPQEYADLVSVTDNGVVTLFRSQANHPPLLINPETDVAPGRYGLSISAIDIDSDPVLVTLETYDPETLKWTSQGERRLPGGRGTLFWQIDPPQDAAEVRYRFSYNDGSYVGVVEPTVGPAPQSPSGLSFPVSAVLVLLVAGSTVGGAILIRQFRRDTARVNRFYRAIVENPADTLVLLNSEYEKSKGSPDFLLNLAELARLFDNDALASLADGLYLLAARPDSALPIILSALSDAEELEPRWWTLSQWLITFQIAQSLFAAPTIAELALILPQFEKSLQSLRSVNREMEVYEAIQIVLTNIRDGERVEQAQDRLIYLNESYSMLETIGSQSKTWPVRVDNTVGIGIVKRLFGLVRSEIEEIKGRAQLDVSLLTRNIIPEEDTLVVLEIRNVGHASARDIRIDLEESPAYHRSESTRFVPLLSPAKGRQIQFSISPTSNDPFRILFSITHRDQEEQSKKTAFADLIQPLKPSTEFKKVINPYSPGMPLRPNSTVFFGREDIFSFVQDNASQLSTRKVLIFVGQRRTGKTSALLQLHQHLPREIIPVYIDCQSLGVTPGMGALLYDFAWSIADALSDREIDLQVPEMATWSQDPAGLFRRHFLPMVREQIPENATLLLLFDEFEAFQNLVDDEILPATFFTFFRHLMQHEPGLSFVFAGTHKLEEIGSDYWSVLFNIALYRRVGFLSENASIELIRKPLEPEIIFDDLAVARILRVTAGHPYFLQLVCYTLVNRANLNKKNYVTITDVNAGIEEMLRLGEVHFAYLWQQSTYVERALLVAAGNLMQKQIPFTLVDLDHYLAQYSISFNPADVTRGLDSLTEREIFQEVREQGKSLYDLRIGLVGIWVSQNKSISRLQDREISSSLSKKNFVTNP